MLELIAVCGGPQEARVLGIDIDIRAHNKAAIQSHPLYKRIEMIEGSSIAPEVITQVSEFAHSAQTVMVCLDSNHTHEHVLQELHHYAPFVSQNSYLIVFDTVVEDLPAELVKDRPWGKGDNPKTAVHQFLSDLEQSPTTGNDNERLRFEIDKTLEQALMITVAPDGYLKRMPPPSL